MDFRDGILAIPTGADIPDIETRDINGVSTPLSGEIIFVPTSGILMYASGTSWLGITIV